MRKNPFDGKSISTKFVWLIYKRLMSREWFSHADVMADKLGYKSAADLPYSISKCPNNGELRKAFLDVLNLMSEKVGKECVETRGNNRGKEFKYIGVEEDPLEDYKNASAINDIRHYAQFCENSAGFFPRSWLEHFFEDSLDLIKINRSKRSGEQVISSGIDRELTNIHLLPELYEAIRDKQVLTIAYKPYEEELVTLDFHPHLLKEHNGRWFLFGHAEGKEPDMGFNLALDRIVSVDVISPQMGKTYIPAPKDFYAKYFEHIVGVSHDANLQPFTIVLRATNYKIYKLTDTKKIHHSQEIIKPFSKYDDGEYGEFKVHVEVNNEFMGRILQMGLGLEVISPPEVRSRFKEIVDGMNKLYQ